MRLDPERNSSTIGRAGRISTDGSAVAVYAIPSDEEHALALASRHCQPSSCAGRAAPPPASP
ncbi:MAG: hypothetical protein ACREQJ_09010, partial [Candidatus Binatia bacterium]